MTQEKNPLLRRVAVNGFTIPIHYRILAPKVFDDRYPGTAGIIPLANYKSVFGMPYPDYMAPLQNGQTLLDSAVKNCTDMRCSSIWIVVNKDVMPLVKKHIGEYDVVRGRIVPIFYVPCNPKDWKKESYAYGAIYGAKIAAKVTTSLSQWTTPSKYFVMWPTTVISHTWIRKKSVWMTFGNREVVYEDDKNETFLDNRMFPFTCNPKRMTEANYYVHRRKNWQFTNFTMDPLQRSEFRISTNRFPARHYDINEVFEPLRLVPFKRVQAPIFDMSTFESYCRNLPLVQEHLDFVGTKRAREKKIVQWNTGNIPDYNENIREIYEI